MVCARGVIAKAQDLILGKTQNTLVPQRGHGNTGLSSCLNHRPPPRKERLTYTYIRYIYIYIYTHKTFAWALRRPGTARGPGGFRGVRGPGRAAVHIPQVLGHGDEAVHQQGLVVEHVPRGPRGFAAPRFRGSERFGAQRVVVVLFSLFFSARVIGRDQFREFRKDSGRSRFQGGLIRGPCYQGRSRIRAELWVTKSAVIAQESSTQHLSTTREPNGSAGSHLHLSTTREPNGSAGSHLRSTKLILAFVTGRNRAASQCPNQPEDAQAHSFSWSWPGHWPSPVPKRRFRFNGCVSWLPRNKMAE